MKTCYFFYLQKKKKNPSRLAALPSPLCLLRGVLATLIIFRGLTFIYAVAYGNSLSTAYLFSLLILSLSHTHASAVSAVFLSLSVAQAKTLGVITESFFTPHIQLISKSRWRYLPNAASCHIPARPLAQALGTSPNSSLLPPLATVLLLFLTQPLK